MAKLELRYTLSKSDEETRARIERVAKQSLSKLDPHVRAVLFLRGACGRAALCHSNFYIYLGAEISTEDELRSWQPAHRLRHYALRHSSINTIAIGARSIYDHARKGDLNAKSVTTLSKCEFAKAVAYWANGNPEKESMARLALTLIQRVLVRCAVSIGAAKQSSCLLTRRIAFMKAYADRQAAHVSLANYEYTSLDVAHVVAVTAVLGAMIHEFDGRTDRGTTWLDAMDKAAYDAGTEMFPALKRLPRLFDQCDLDNMFKVICEGKLTDGPEYLSTWLPSALGWDGPTKPI